MQVNALNARQASEMVAQGAQLIDIRDAQEYAREHVAAATLVPLTQWQQGSALPALKPETAVIFMCQSGMRSDSHAALLASRVAPAPAYVLQGGLNGWKQAGLPTIEDRRQPLPLMRQVQIAAGSLVLLGVILGYGVSTGFFLLSAFVGAGLLFAGVSGFCGMARLLMKMPWNRGLSR